MGTDNLIATNDELNILFDTKEKRDAFCSIITRILNEIISRTIEVPFVRLEEITE